MKIYDPSENCITFQLNSKYEVKIKSSVKSSIDKISYFRKIPYSVINDHIFTFMTAYEYFFILIFTLFFN